MPDTEYKTENRPAADAADVAVKNGGGLREALDQVDYLQDTTVADMDAEWSQNPEVLANIENKSFGIDIEIYHPDLKIGFQASEVNLTDLQHINTFIEAAGGSFEHTPGSHSRHYEEAVQNNVPEGELFKLRQNAGKERGFIADVKARFGRIKERLAQRIREFGLTPEEVAVLEEYKRTGRLPEGISPEDIGKGVAGAGLRTAGERESAAEKTDRNPAFAEMERRSSDTRNAHTQQTPQNTQGQNGRNAGQKTLEQEDRLSDASRDVRQVEINERLRSSGREAQRSTAEEVMRQQMREVDAQMQTNRGQDGITRDMPVFVRFRSFDDLYAYGMAMKARELLDPPQHVVAQGQALDNVSGREDPAQLRARQVEQEFAAGSRQNHNAPSQNISAQTREQLRQGQDAQRKEQQLAEQQRAERTAQYRQDPSHDKNAEQRELHGQERNPQERNPQERENVREDPANREHSFAKEQPGDMGRNAQQAPGAQEQTQSREDIIAEYREQQQQVPVRATEEPSRDEIIAQYRQQQAEQAPQQAAEPRTHGRMSMEELQAVTREAEDAARVHNFSSELCDRAAFTANTTRENVVLEYEGHTYEFLPGENSRNQEGVQIWIDGQKGTKDDLIESMSSLSEQTRADIFTKTNDIYVERTTRAHDAGERTQIDNMREGMAQNNRNGEDR